RALGAALQQEVGGDHQRLGTSLGAGTRDDTAGGLHVRWRRTSRELQAQPGHGLEPARSAANGLPQNGWTHMTDSTSTSVSPGVLPPYSPLPEPMLSFESGSRFDSHPLRGLMTHGPYTRTSLAAYTPTVRV